MTMQSELLKDRTKHFALDAFEVVKSLPTAEPGATVRRQLAKAAAAVAANYRASRRARSHQEFTAKISVVAEEADESCFWLELVSEAGMIASPSLSKVLHESQELAAIFSAMVGTARRNQRSRR